MNTKKNAQITFAGITFFLRGIITEALPILGVFGLGFQKMLPIIQNIYLSFHD